jgi:ComEC/Rec2-related protein
MGLWIGTALGLGPFGGAVDDAMLDASLLASLTCLIVAIAARHHRRVAHPMMLATIALSGWLRAGHERTAASIDALSVADRSPTLARVRLRLNGFFRAPDPVTRDMLDTFVQPRVEARWSTDATLIATHDGRAWNGAHGVVRIEAPADSVDLEPHGEVVATGWIGPMPIDPHPGASPRTRSRDMASSVLRVETVPAVVELPPWSRRAERWLQRWLDGNLIRCLDWPVPERIRSLVIAMTTGRELPGVATMRESFRSAGLSHFLAISGFNVAVVFVMARVLMEALRVPWRLRGWLLATFGLLFLIAVERDVSVVRAGISGSLAGLSLALRRGWCVHGLLGTSAMLTMLVDPWSALDPGFQLSYGAVLGLTAGTRPMLALLGDRGLAGSCSWWWRLLRGARTAIAASLAAWMVSVPITLHFAGSMNPWCAFTGTLLAPLAATITVLASIAAAFGWIPVVEWLVQPALGRIAGCMVECVELCRDLPVQSWSPGRIPWWWAITGLLALGGWWRLGRPTTSAPILMGTAAWIAVAAAIASSTSVGEPVEGRVIRWTMIDTGEGTCHVIQTADSVVVIDPGSRSRRCAGSRLLVPTLQALGVRRIDRIVVRGDRIERFSALPEIVHHIRVDGVVLGQDWTSDHSSESPQAMLRNMLRSIGMPTHLAQAHDGWTCGELEWIVGRSGEDGELMLMARIASGDPRAWLMLPGGTDPVVATAVAEACGLERPLALEWDGSARAATDSVAMLARLRPSCLMQAQGNEPAEPLRIRNAVGPVPWGVLERDGCLRFSVDPSRPKATMALERWENGHWIPVRP